jgi:hypothetical protein
MTFSPAMMVRIERYAAAMGASVPDVTEAMMDIAHCNPQLTELELGIVINAMSANRMSRTPRASS